MNHSSKKADLVSSAFRIYLMHTLNQTEDIIQATRRNESLSTCFFRADSISRDIIPHDGDVLVKAEKVVGFIKNFQGALEASPSIARSFFHGLCVVEALQDSLHEALRSSQSYSQGMYAFHVGLSEKHACKASYLTFAYEAAQREGDRQLSVLWSLAARKLEEEIHLKRRDSRQPTPLMKKYLLKADAEEVNIAQHRHEWSAQRLHLHLRALHHHRCAAAMRALERHHSHDFAASLCALCDQTTLPSEVVLLEKAAAHWQAAVTLVEIHAGNSLDVQSQDYLRMQDCVDKARRLLCCLPQVRKLDKEREALASTVVAEISCRDATMLRVWRILRAEQENAIVKYERVVACDATY